MGIGLLPKYSPRIYGRKLTCLRRDKKVLATPEERVRQRALKWILTKVLKRQIELEEHQAYTNSRGGRPDIVIKDKKGKPRLIVELKEPNIEVGYDVFLQARRYARKIGATEIWLSNGDDNKFYRLVEGDWREILFGNVLGLKLKKPGALPVPNPRNRKAVRQFITNLCVLADRDSRKVLANVEPEVLAIRKLIAMPSKEIALPFSWDGIHLLEDRGVSRLSIPVPAGTPWQADYRVFLAATEGRVETVGIGLNVCNDGDVYLCMAFIKPNRKHHALQLRLGEYSRKVRSGWEIWHSGRMGGRALKTGLVFEGLKEAGIRVLQREGGKSAVELGLLPSFDRIRWTTSRRFLANLIHYALVRSNLREDHKYQAKED
jgi:hypothetical protein